jgi:formate--tetrahydrofolate ligase
VAQDVYGAAGVEYSESALQKLARLSAWGMDRLPICIAKTQYSLSDDRALPGAPTGWTLHVSDVALSAGAGFVVVICGAIMLMPGLPKEPRAADIDVSSEGAITGIS